MSCFLHIWMQNTYSKSFFPTVSISLHEAQSASQMFSLEIPCLLDGMRASCALVKSQFFFSSETRTKDPLLPGLNDCRRDFFGWVSLRIRFGLSWPARDLGRLPGWLICNFLLAVLAVVSSCRFLLAVGSFFMSWPLSATGATSPANPKPRCFIASFVTQCDRSRALYIIIIYKARDVKV